MSDQRKKPGNARKWLYRLAAMILAPALALGVLELALRLFGYGYSTSFFEDGSAWEGRDVWIDSPHFGRWVFPRNLRPVPQPLPFAIPKVKDRETVRIFVLGESAALGFPDPSTSFPRILEVMLKAAYPLTRWEVVNTAMVAINSHVALQIARQCAECQPDLFVVHLGNNEVIGPFGAAGVLGPFAPRIGLIRANLAAKRTRLGQLFDQVAQSLAPAAHASQQWEGVRMFLASHLRQGDERLTRIHELFRQNLEDICRAATDAGAPVILCTIPVNLKDSPPFGSLHAQDLELAASAKWEMRYNEGVRLEEEGDYARAIGFYQQAERIDGEFADLAYRLGRCSYIVGDDSRAAQYYAQARDLDTLRFRTDSALNETVRGVAGGQSPRSPGVVLADAERAFADASPARSPGENLFLEYVHMNFHGNYLLARTVFDALATNKLVSGRQSAVTHRAPLTEIECAARLGHTEWSEWKFGEDLFDQFLQKPPFTLQLDHAARCQRWTEKLAAQRQRLQSGGREKALAVYRNAVGRISNPSELMAGGRIGNPSFGAAGDWPMRMNYAQLLIECGDWQSAHQQYELAAAELRHNFTALSRLGKMELTMGQTGSAERRFRDAVRIEPDDLETNIGLAEALERQGKIALAESVLQRQARTHAQQAYALGALGRFLMRRGRLEEAKARFTEAAAREPNLAAIRIDLAMLAVKQGNYEEAIRQLEAALQIQPDSPELRERLAELKRQRRGR